MNEREIPANGASLVIVKLMRSVPKNSARTDAAAPPRTLMPAIFAASLGIARRHSAILTMSLSYCSRVSVTIFGSTCSPRSTCTALNRRASSRSHQRSTPFPLAFNQAHGTYDTSCHPLAIVRRARFARSCPALPR